MEVLVDSCIDFIPTHTFALLVISCSSSIFGSVIIFWTYWKIPAIRNFSRKLLLFLTVADLLTAIGNLIGGIRYFALEYSENPCKRLQKSDSVCVAQSFITTFSSMASFFWTVAIAGYIVLQLTVRSVGTRSKRALVVYNLICWGFPGYITVLALCLGVLGQDNSVGTGGWCWITSAITYDQQNFWMFVSGKAWEITCYILTTLLYMVTKMILCKRAQHTAYIYSWIKEEEEDFRLEDRNFIFVPFILYLLRLWGTIRFVIALAKKEGGSNQLNMAQKVLMDLQSVGDSWQGFWNFVLFCVVDNTVRDYLYRVVTDNRCCRKETHVDVQTERSPILSRAEQNAGTLVV
ncbi:G-protein coupled receptor 157-like [Mya arenaria]|uniref:G-protein coupled receptor 157-like n=1 Tax=Mya arenaria TaxID=6604 RepID=UPI0022E2E21B|nr:G-protein coupled receptor 157-like [Mya arenaria]